MLLKSNRNVADRLRNKYKFNERCSIIVIKLYN